MGSCCGVIFTCNALLCQHLTAVARIRVRIAGIVYSVHDQQASISVIAGLVTMEIAVRKVLHNWTFLQRCSVYLWSVWAFVVSYSSKCKPVCLVEQTLQDQKECFWLPTHTLSFCAVVYCKFICFVGWVTASTWQAVSFFLVLQHVSSIEFASMNSCLVFPMKSGNYSIVVCHPISVQW